jgi:S-adenosylmethionine hydrolase
LVIVLFTDFGAAGPYLGLMEVALRSQAPDIPIINLVSDAPTGDPLRSGYLLAALGRALPSGSVVLSVVDPGVGGERLPVVLKAGDCWYVGPENGLFNTIACQSGQAEWWIIDWRPDRLSASFHGRDLFAPIAARIAQQDFSWKHRPYSGPDLGAWPADLDEVIYFDHYGNAITGRRYLPDLNGQSLRVNGWALPQAATFCEMPVGESFWYGNSMGLVEIAVNRGRADRSLNLKPGDRIIFG